MQTMPLCNWAYYLVSAGYIMIYRTLKYLQTAIILPKRQALFSFIIFLAFTTTGNAYVSSAGHRYEYKCNKHGLVLSSKHPISRFVGSGAGTSIVEGIETIFLGVSCDAQHKVFGTGKWGWANGGFLIEFDKTSIGFPRQELHCDIWANSDVCQL